MIRFDRLILQLFVLTALVSMQGSPTIAQQLGRAERPEPKVGDSTVFQDHDIRSGEKKDTAFRLISIAPDKLVTEISGATSGTRTFTRDWNLIEIKTGEVVAFTYTPYMPHLQFPLELGRTWEIPFEVEVTQRVNRSAKWQWKARVAAAEAVTVPAGTFQAYRVEYDATFATRQGNASWTGTHKETAWYAPELGRMIKRDYEQVVPANRFLDHHVIEITTFKPAP
jgi:hypothetical protein